MSDIVKRLRLLVPSDSSGAAFDAIDEIQRLRAENERLRDEATRIALEAQKVCLQNIQMKFALGYPMDANLEKYVLPENPFKCGTCAALRAALSTARADALEEAARCADDHRLPLGDFRAPYKIAAAIRALKKKPHD